MIDFARKKSCLTNNKYFTIKRSPNRDVKNQFKTSNHVLFKR